MTDTGDNIPHQEGKAPLLPAALPVRQIIVGGVGFIIFVTVLTLAVQTIGVEKLQGAIEDAGPAAPLFYILLKAVTYIFAPLTSGPMQVVAGTLFGSVWLGVLYTLIGEVLGGSVSFWIARRFGRGVATRFVGEAGMAQVDQFYAERMGGWRSLAVARIVLFSLWDFLSYAAGLSPVRYRTYFLISSICGFFPTLLFVGLGNVVMVDSSMLLVLYVGVALLVIIPVALYAPVRRYLDKRAERKRAAE